MLISSSLRFVLIILFTLSLLSCEKDDGYAPTLEKYTTDTELLKNVSLKFFDERDPVALHKAALGLQLTRAMNCMEYNGECAGFSDFLSEAINLSQDGHFAPAEQFKLRKKYDELVVIIEEGKEKLKKSP
ncbi:MAG: hypothetical protein K2P92_02410 [Bdellovibrionaceae bacterium]|nr:hypothetical protein [Pseudobdellovibrionaceae bacterium]